MPTFDVVTTVDMQEVLNAVDQAKKEIAQRWDFKGSQSEISLTDAIIQILADDQMKLSALQEIIKQKLAKRKIALESVIFKDPTKAGGNMIKQLIEVKQSLTTDELKRLAKIIKQAKVKAQSTIQEKQLRVSSKSRDTLQEMMELMKKEAPDLPLEFTNFRD